MEEKIEIQYQGTTVKPTYGGKRIEAEYTMTHTKYGRVNSYKVVCELIGLANVDPHFSVYSAEFIGDFEKDSNDETLTESAVAELFDAKYDI